MPIFIHKSAENQFSAEQLSNNQDGLEIASVHCAYYSIFQLIKYILNHYLGINYQQQTDLTKNEKQSHKIIVNALKKDICTNHQSSFLSISRNYGELKQRRTIADYSNNELNPQEINECKELANNLKTELAQIYNITL